MINKTGVITWHYYPNFGSALQAYALHTYININGGDAELINYMPDKPATLKALRLIVSFIDGIVPYTISKRLHYRFFAFHRTYFKETEVVRDTESLKAIAKKYDALVCGSDQIWAPNVFNDVYMLSFAQEGQKLYSYAASIGLPEIPAKLQSTYKSLLSKFDLISVREEQGKNLLKELFDIDSTAVIDPTLLLNKAHYQSIARESSIQKKMKDNYILCYFLGENEHHRKIVEELAAKSHKKVVCLSRFAMDLRNTFITDTDAGPLEFLSYIANADVVVTDSFHGMCFSINLNKEFYVMKRFTEDSPINQNSRIINILGKLGLENRLINDVPSESSSIDYVRVNEKLNVLRLQSRAFLKSCNLIED